MRAKTLIGHKREKTFERSASSLQSGSFIINVFFKYDNENATEASYIVTLHIAKSRVPHNIAETLIKP